MTDDHISRLLNLAGEMVRGDGMPDYPDDWDLPRNATRKLRMQIYRAAETAGKKTNEWARAITTIIAEARDEK